MRGVFEKFENQPRHLLRPRSINFRQHFLILSHKTVPLRKAKFQPALQPVNLPLESVSGAQDTGHPGVLEQPRRSYDAYAYSHVIRMHGKLVISLLEVNLVK
jgi:hypothetical protein